VSAGVAAVLVLWAGEIPARAVSRCCACAVAEATHSRVVAANTMAGECGNRTHPALLSKVAVILKITEATRPHPPPSASRNFDREFSTRDNLSDNYCAIDA
jgi:hypothetical protein